DRARGRAHLAAGEPAGISGALFRVVVGRLAARGEDDRAQGRRAAGTLTRSLEHDPEKACPGLDPGWVPVFGKRSCSIKKLERDDDSNRLPARGVCSQNPLIDSLSSPHKRRLRGDDSHRSGFRMTRVQRNQLRPAAARCSAAGSTTTLVPILTRSYRSITSSLTIRMHPAVARLPM